MCVCRQTMKGLTLAGGILLVSFPGSALAREEVQILRPADNPDSGGGFGRAVSIRGDDIAVGRDSRSAAYVFTRDGESWIEQAKVTRPVGALFDSFGWSVAIDGNLLVVGAPFWPPISARPGEVYAFRREGTNWIAEGRLISSGSNEQDGFGISVGMSSDRVAVGAPSELGGGAVYVFRREGTEWVEEVRLIPSDAVGGDGFGGSVSMSVNFLVAGARGDDDAGDHSGSAYVFRREGTTWIQDARLAAFDAAQWDFFGEAVSINGEYTVVGAPGNSGRGSAYVFRRTRGNWVEQVKLTASDAGGGDKFGAAVAIDGTLILVGAPYADDTGGTPGSAYLYRGVGRTWEEVDKLVTRDALSFGRFGSSVAVDGEFAVVGALAHSAYVYAVGDAVIPPGIPAVSAWGLMIMGLLLAAGGKIFFGRKRLRGGRFSQTLPALLSALAFLSTSLASAQAPDLTVPHHPEHILVRFKPQVSDETAQLVNSAVGALRLKKYRFVNGLHLVKVPPERLADALSDYLGRAEVMYAEPDYAIELVGASCDPCDADEPNCPNEPALTRLWGLHNTGQTIVGGVLRCGDPDYLPDPGTCDADIDAPEAWSLFTGDPEFAVAVIDSGLAYNHEDFFHDINGNGQLDPGEPSNIWINPGEDHEPLGFVGPEDFDEVDDDDNGLVDDLRGYDFSAHDNDPMDGLFHGTHIAGTIGAFGDNGIGVSGINWRCKMVGLKIGPEGDLEGFVSYIVDSLEYCIDKDIKVSNLSAVVVGDYATQALKDVIEQSQDIDHIFVVAAGNWRRNVDVEPKYPCSYDLPNIICVAATDNDDNLADWPPINASNYGAMSVDLAAPGTNIYSTNTTEVGGGWVYCSGTSMAAPHVTGVVALVMARYPRMSWEAVRDKVLMTVRTPIPDPNPLAGKTVTGGVVNAAAALDCNGNGVRDDCDIDCDPEECEAPCTVVSVDSCNQNWIPDECEPDCDGNGTPDECDPWFPDPPGPEATPNPKPRYISLLPGNAGQQTALRVTLTDFPQFPGHVGWQWWVGPPHEVCENAGQGADIFCSQAGECTNDNSPCSINADCCAPAPGLPNLSFMAAPLQCQPEYMDWPATVGSDVVLHVYGLATLDGSEVAPESTYKIQALHLPVHVDCDPPTEWAFSDALTVTTSKWGDVCGPGPGGACSGSPDGIVDVANDVLGVLDKFTNTMGLEKVRCDLEGRIDDSGIPDFKVNVANDVLYCVGAFTANPFPFTVTQEACP